MADSRLPSSKRQVCKPCLCGMMLVPSCIGVLLFVVSPFLRPVSSLLEGSSAFRLAHLHLPVSTVETRSRFVLTVHLLCDAFKSVAMLFRFLAIQRWAYPLLCDATQRFSVVMLIFSMPIYAVSQHVIAQLLRCGAYRRAAPHILCVSRGSRTRISLFRCFATVRFPSAPHSRDRL